LVTVLVVSDYRGGDAKAWEDMRRSLAGLVDQDYEGEVEVLLVESRGFLADLPDDLPRQPEHGDSVSKYRNLASIIS
jgi:hypothetical protein